MSREAWPDHWSCEEAYERAMWAREEERENALKQPDRQRVEPAVPAHRETCEMRRAREYGIE
jgi:hypothetical protein